MDRSASFFPDESGFSLRSNTKASKNSWPQSPHLTRANPLWRMPQSSPPWCDKLNFELKILVNSLGTGPLQVAHEIRSGPGIAVNNFSHIGAEKAVLPGKALIIDLFKSFEMILNTPVILRILWLSRMIY